MAALLTPYVAGQRQLRVDWFTPKEGDELMQMFVKNVFVSNLPLDAKAEELQAIFSVR
jgi:hypothetical protein